MGEVFVVLKKGIYRHEVWGIRTTLPDAVILAKDMLRKEPDDHHCAEVALVPVDGDAPEKPIGTVERRDHGRNWDHVNNRWISGDVVLTWKDAKPDA